MTSFGHYFLASKKSLECSVLYARAGQAEKKWRLLPHPEFMLNNPTDFMYSIVKRFSPKGDNLEYCNEQRIPAIYYCS